VGCSGAPLWCYLGQPERAGAGKWSEMQGDDAGYGVTPMPAAHGACILRNIARSVCAGPVLL
jgi:hypothetical protein